MSAKRRSPAQIVVTVEHASPRVPAALEQLGLPDSVMASHYAWDPGAATVGRAIARAFDAPLHLSRWSRLVVDLNRTSNHPRVIARTLEPMGRRIRANELDRHERRARLEQYWFPWRDAVGVDLDRAIEVAGAAFHISVHSFVERLRGELRDNHFGLLYDPSHRIERALADRLHARLAERGYRVRRNFPYSGLDDGHCMRQRKNRRRYVGMEIEMNQRWVRDPRRARAFGRDLVAAFAPEFAPSA